MIDTHRKDYDMQEVIFDLQTITPLFLAGADQQAAELRAPSFRGLMRYWLRASVGGIVGTGPDGRKKVADVEKSVLGATDRSSSIQVRIQHDQIAPMPFAKEGQNRHTATGRDYLFWSVAERRYQIPPLTPFHIILTARQYAQDKEQEALKRAISAFWLLTHLGSIGSRSRRCAGSLSIRGYKGDVFDFPFQTPTTIDNLQEQLRQGIRLSQELYKGEPTGFQQKPLFDILHQSACDIWILLNNGYPWQDRNQALRDIGKRLQSYRDTLSLDQRKIFGIPVMVLERGRSQPYHITGAGFKFRRLASPLHLRLAELREGHKVQYAGIATLFKTRWENMSEAEYDELYPLIDKLIEQEFVMAKRVTYDAR